MNERFYTLPSEKQQKIINAGFRVFSQNSYRKSPMQEIADEAGISKSLLFHYFRNKKDLYLFLWNTASDITCEYLALSHCYDSEDLFEMMERGMYAKIQIMCRYPDMAAFAMKAFYEKDEAVRQDIQESYREHFNRKAADALTRLNPEDFIPGLDLKMMHRQIYLMSVGYLWEISQRGDTLDAGELKKTFSEMLLFWKSVYLR
jgi:Transcriptional regulator